MTDQKRDPHADNELIDDDLPTPSQGGSSGGRIEREIGALDEEKTATGAGPHPTSVKKGQKPDGGDEPTLPNRTQTAKDKTRRRRAAPVSGISFVEPGLPFAEVQSCALSPMP